MQEVIGKPARLNSRETPGQSRSRAGATREQDSRAHFDIKEWVRPIGFARQDALPRACIDDGNDEAARSRANACLALLRVGVQHKFRVEQLAEMKLRGPRDSNSTP